MMYNKYIPYLLEYNHKVIMFKMGFWVRLNSKNPSKRVLFYQTWGSFQEKPQRKDF